MSTTVEYVNVALDRYVRKMRARVGFDAYGVQAKTLAGLIGIDTDEMSDLLQRYLDAQRVANSGARYVIGCEGYGTVARWRILSMPGADPTRVQHARREHAEHVVDDAVLRYIRDVNREVAPALKRAQHDPTIRSVLALAAQQLRAVALFVHEALGNGTPQGGINK